MSLYRAGSLMTVSCDLVGVQEVRCGEVVALNLHENTNFLMERGISFFHKITISEVKRAELVIDRMSHITLRGRWCHIIIQNVHASIDDKTDDTKDSFYEELE
jgi:hypothetical protein